MRTVPKMLLAAALLIPLAGCQTTGGAGIEATCAQWRGISWSRKDTLQTVDDVKANNARRKAFCAS